MAKEVTLGEVHELLMHVAEHMATKEETATKTELAEGLAGIRAEMAEGFAAVREEMATKVEMSAGFASVRSELSEVKERLTDVETAVENLSGLTTETDDLSDRMGRVERHVGLQAL
ncbi:hypothetical protein HY416_01940 [Candidatus Kaiserbacteria bacterium]|nr:hypothetical protein [Candidatus Kaiserbacteria bacterium]